MFVHSVPFRAPSLVAAYSGLVGHPVVAGLVVPVETLARELAVLREENADLRRQLGRHSSNSGQLPSRDGQAAPPRTRSPSTPVACMDETGL